MLICQGGFLEGWAKDMYSYDWPEGPASRSFQDWVDAASLGGNRQNAEDAIRKGWLADWLDSIGEKDLTPFIREHRGDANGLALMRQLAKMQLIATVKHHQASGPSDRAASAWSAGDDRPGAQTLALLEGIMRGVANSHSGSNSAPRIPAEIMLAVTLRDIAKPAEIIQVIRIYKEIEAIERNSRIIGEFGGVSMVAGAAIVGTAVVVAAPPVALGAGILIFAGGIFASVMSLAAPKFSKIKPADALLVGDLFSKLKDITTQLEQTKEGERP
jgi:hypothetical protein